MEYIYIWRRVLFRYLEMTLNGIGMKAIVFRYCVYSAFLRFFIHYINVLNEWRYGQFLILANYKRCVQTTNMLSEWPKSLLACKDVKKIENPFTICGSSIRYFEIRVHTILRNKTQRSVKLNQIASIYKKRAQGNVYKIS